LDSRLPKQVIDFCAVAYQATSVDAGTGAGRAET